MLKKILFTFFIFFSIHAIYPKVFSQDISAKELNKRIGRGINILGYDEEFWENINKGKFKRKYFNMIKEAGFTSVRINLRYLLSKMDNTYVINSKWFESLDSIIYMGRKAKLIMILDFHDMEINKDLINKKDLFFSAWKQISERYKDQPNDLIFEILNEPSPNIDKKIWNKYLLEVINLIRKSNPRRNLIVGGIGDWTGSVFALNLPENDKNIIVTIHFYYPMEFTHQGIIDKYPVNHEWKGTKQEKDAIEKSFKKISDWSIANGRPIYIGEFGANVKADMDSRVRWTSFVARTAEKHGFSWTYWYFDQTFTLYNIYQERWVEPLLKVLINK